MRKMVIIVMLLGICALPVFAGEALEFTGTVDSISPIDPSRGADDGSINVADPAGKMMHFMINPVTSVVDESGNKINSTDIEDGDTVKASYSVSDNGNIASAIMRIQDLSASIEGAGAKEKK